MFKESLKLVRITNLANCGRNYIEYTMWWFRDSLHIQWCHAPQQIALLFAVCIFGGFCEIVFTSRHKQARRYAINKLDDSPQHRIISARASNVLQRRVCCTMRHYAEPFHATLHCLHVRCTILHHAEPFHAMLDICVYALPFDITLTHVTQGYTVCVYAVPFDISLSHFTQRYTICVYAIPFYITLSKLTQCYTVCAYAVLLDITLSHFTQRYAV